MAFVRIWLALVFMLPSILIPRQTPVVTPDQIIQAVNAVRTAKGLPALRANAILMGTAQYTADIMAANQAGSHLGGVKERIIAAGYGSGSPADSIWGTEDFAVDPGGASAAQIVHADWSDDVHMIPMANRNYCDVGAGVSQAADGSYYFVLHAAYNSDLPCGKTAPVVPVGKGTPTTTATASAPQWIVPINRATPDADGRIVHIVRQGQTLWYIAISYGTKIIAIQQLNGMSPDDKTLYNGEKLLIPTSLTPQPTETDTPKASPVPADSVTPLPTAAGNPDQTPVPALSATPTPDPNEQALADERFRGGLFIALVISIVLIAAGVLINRR